MKLSDNMNIEWLKVKVTVDEAEKQHLIQNDRLGPNPIPFGYKNVYWEEIKSNMMDGDELWEFSSPEETWENMCGSAGICIVRGGKIISRIVTIRN